MDYNNLQICRKNQVVPIAANLTPRTWLPIIRTYGPTWPKIEWHDHTTKPFSIYCESFPMVAVNIFP